MRLIIIRMAFRTGNIKFTWPFRLFSRYHWISRWISYIWQRLLWCSFLLTVLSIDIPLCSFRAWYALICGCIENWCILCAGNAILSVEIREIFRAMDTCLVGFWYLCHIFTPRGMRCIWGWGSSFNFFSLLTVLSIDIPLCSFRAWYALICGCIENWCILCAGNAILSVEIREIFRAMDTCLVGFWYLCHIFTPRGMRCIRSTFSSIYSLYTLSAIFIPSPFTLTGCTLHICWIK